MENTDFNLTVDPDLMNETLRQLINDIDRVRLNLIQQQLVRRGISYDIFSAKNTRFKKIIREVRHDREVFFYDDGSEDGLQLITFWTEQNTSFDQDGCVFGAQTKLQYSIP